MYADDHQIFASRLSTGIVEGKLMSEGNKITQWWRKTCYKWMFRNINPCYWAVDFILRTIEIYQIIRSIRLDSELNFSEHINSDCKIASQQMEVSVRLLKTLIPTHAKLQLYKAPIILSHLTYCSTGRGGGGGWGIQGKSHRGVPPRPSRSRPCLRQKLLISLPCLRQETLLSNPNLFCCVVLHTELTNFSH